MMSRRTPAARRLYRVGLRKPTRAPSHALSSAMSAAHWGAAALVPPITVRCVPSSLMITTPVAGSPTALTAGTPRPCLRPGLAEGGTPASFCHVGRGNRRLTPPPVALPGPSFHTLSLEILHVVGDERRPAHAEHVRARGGEVGVRPVATALVARAVVPRGAADRDALGRRRRERVVGLPDRIVVHALRGSSSGLP